MTQYNTLNVKLSHSQLNKLKSGIKNGTQVTMNLSPNVVGESNDKTHFSNDKTKFVKSLQMVHQLM